MLLFGGVSVTKKKRQSERGQKFSFQQTAALLPPSFLSLPPLHPSLSVFNVSTPALPLLVNVSFGFFYFFFFPALPSLILQGSHSGFSADLSKSPTVEDMGVKGGRGRNGGRLCLRVEETEMEVTNLSKSPAETGSATECQAENERGERGRPERDLLYLNTQLMVPIGGERFFLLPVFSEVSDCNTFLRPRMKTSL